MRTNYEAIVIGLGGLGSAALYRLARELGSSVLGIEQFRLGHSRGASQDHSRIIRLAQHQSQYAALAPDAYSSWYEVEEESGVKILTRTGGLVIEDPGGRDPERVGTRDIEGYVAAFEEFGFDYELLDADALMEHWPQFRLRGGERAVYQEESGIVDAARANAVHVALARSQGGRILEETPVRAIVPDPNGDGVEVVTDHESYHARRVVVTADAWTNEVLKGDRVPLAAHGNPGAGNLLRHAEPEGVLTGEVSSVYVARGS